MLTQLQNTIRKHRLLSFGEHVLVAVSGGADSVALLCALRDLSPSLGLRLTVAHLNHRIRGRAADGDAAFVRRLARRLKAPVVLGRTDVPHLAKQEGLSLEMAARKARYDFLAAAARKVKAHVIATAHTADDQAETVLLKLIRGAGPKGLAGIPLESTLRKTRIVRPLLEVPRDAIVAFLRERGESWREDETNRDESFQRNKVRHRILPLLESELNPQVRIALRRTADILREEDGWLDSLAASLLASCRCGARGLSIRSLRRRPLAARRRVLRLWLVAAGIPAEWIAFDAVDRIERLAAGPKASATVQVAGPWTVERRTDHLQVRSQKPAPLRAFRLPVRIPGKTVVKSAGLTITTSLAPGLVKDRAARLGAYPARASLNWAAVGNRKVFVRSWRPGDRMKPLGMMGSKKIQDIFVDEKVPADQRRGLPLFECGGEIVWLPGHRVARGWEVSRPSERSLQIVVDRPARTCRVATGAEKNPHVACMKTPRDHLTCKEAALLLKVSSRTIQDWVKTGFLPGVVKKDPVRGTDFVFVPRSRCMRNVFVVKCLWCKRKFRAKRPRKARYCCYRHNKAAFLNRAARNDYPEVRRFKKRKKEETAPTAPLPSLA